MEPKKSKILGGTDMKVTVINGNSHHGNTWHCKEIFIQELSKKNNLDITEFTLPKDMPHFCNGCFSCFYNGEDTCPHAANVAPIANALTEADLIIFTTPVYAMDISGQLKVLLDHLCFMWLSHRPNPKMFDKIALTISTTAGAGLGHTAKTLNNSLTFWGVKKIYNYKNPIAAMKWSDVSEKKQAKIAMKMTALAKKVSNAVNNVHSIHSPIFRSFMFFMMKGMMKKNTWNLRDKEHWVNEGWLSGSKPF
jgi:multimeric flavodoxin WrbA